MPSTDHIRLPFAESIAIFRARLASLVPTAGWRDLLANAHDRAFAVAGAAKADLLADLAEAVERAVVEGGTLAEFQAAFDEIVERHGWDFRGPRDWRARAIYNTNMNTQYARGRLAQLESPELRALKPFWMYQHNDAVTHPRPIHVSWDGITLPPDHPWWRTHWPPNGWGCQCYVVAVNEREARALGGRMDVEPDLDTEGVDEGWDHRPGDQAELVQNIRARARSLPDPLRAGLNNDLENPQ